MHFCSSSSAYLPLADEYRGQYSVLLSFLCSPMIDLCEDLAEGPPMVSAVLPPNPTPTGAPSRHLG